MSAEHKKQYNDEISKNLLKKPTPESVKCWNCLRKKVKINFKTGEIFCKKCLDLIENKELYVTRSNTGNTTIFLEKSSSGHFNLSIRGSFLWMRDGIEYEASWEDDKNAMDKMEKLMVQEGITL